MRKSKSGTTFSIDSTSTKDLKMIAMVPTIQELIERFSMQAHPEGGYFSETYRSSGSISEVALNGNHNGDRSFSTAIYFLLTSKNFSAFHRLRQDEVWHFYFGSPLYVHVIGKSGQYTRHVVGNNIAHGEVPQLVVAAGDWFGSSVVGEESYSFVGCTVAPGFDFRDFEMANRKELTRQFPLHESVIQSLTR